VLGGEELLESAGAGCCPHMCRRPVQRRGERGEGRGVGLGWRQGCDQPFLALGGLPPAVRVQSAGVGLEWGSGERYVARPFLAPGGLPAVGCRQAASVGVEGWRGVGRPSRPLRQAVYQPLGAGRRAGWGGEVEGWRGVRARPSLAPGGVPAVGCRKAVLVGMERWRGGEGCDQPFLAPGGVPAVGCRQAVLVGVERWRSGDGCRASEFLRQAVYQPLGAGRRCWLGAGWWRGMGWDGLGMMTPVS